MFSVCVARVLRMEDPGDYADIMQTQYIMTLATTSITTLLILYKTWYVRTQSHLSKVLQN